MISIRPCGGVELPVRVVVGETGGLVAAALFPDTFTMPGVVSGPFSGRITVPARFGRPLLASLPDCESIWGVTGARPTGRVPSGVLSSRLTRGRCACEVLAAPETLFRASWLLPGCA